MGKVNMNPLESRKYGKTMKINVLGKMEQKKRKEMQLWLKKALKTELTWNIATAATGYNTIINSELEKAGMKFSFIGAEQKI